MYYKRIQGMCFKIYRSVATAGEKQKQREVFFFLLYSHFAYMSLSSKSYLFLTDCWNYFFKKKFIYSLDVYHVYHYYIFASEDVTIIEIAVTMHASVYVWT